jgi:hypothetical protein
MVEIVRKNVAAGRTAEQMVQDHVLGEYAPRYSLLSFLTPNAWLPGAAAAMRQGTSK